MNTIITDNSKTEHQISSKIDLFFSAFVISKLLKKSNFYKESDIQCIVVLKEIFGLVFSGKNLFRTLKMNPEDMSFKKNTAYRFLNSSSYNWASVGYRSLLQSGQIPPSFDKRVSRSHL